MLADVAMLDWDRLVQTNVHGAAATSPDLACPFRKSPLSAIVYRCVRYRWLALWVTAASRL